MYFSYSHIIPFFFVTLTLNLHVFFTFFTEPWPCTVMWLHKTKRSRRFKESEILCEVSSTMLFQFCTASVVLAELFFFTYLFVYVKSICVTYGTLTAWSHVWKKFAFLKWYGLFVEFWLHRVIRKEESAKVFKRIKPSRWSLENFVLQVLLWLYSCAKTYSAGLFTVLRI